MGTHEAMSFIAEAFELQQLGARKEAPWAELKDPMIAFALTVAAGALVL